MSSQGQHVAEYCTSLQLSLRDIPCCGDYRASTHIFGARLQLDINATFLLCCCRTMPRSSSVFNPPHAFPLSQPAPRQMGLPLLGSRGCCYTHALVHKRAGTSSTAPRSSFSILAAVSCLNNIRYIVDALLPGACMFANMPACAAPTALSWGLLQLGLPGCSIPSFRPYLYCRRAAARGVHVCKHVSLCCTGSPFLGPAAARAPWLLHSFHAPRGTL